MTSRQPPPLNEDLIARRERRRIARRKALPLVLAAIGLVAAPLIIWVILTNPLFQDPQPQLGQLQGLNLRSGGLAIGAVIGLLVLVWLGSLLTLVMDGGKLLFGRRRQPERTCPNCGVREALPAVAFAHKVIPGTGWQENTCPHCRKVWHTRL